MIEEYYKILGVNSNSSMDEIKKAFKTKALILHPDRNKSLDAHEQFVLLNEAYQYVVNVKTGRIYNSQKRAYTPQQPYRSFDEYATQQREQARKRAEFYANKRYQDFKESAYYKQSIEIKGMANQLLIVIILLFILLVPSGGYLIAQHYGLYAGLAILVFASPSIIPLLKEAGSLNPLLLRKALIHVCQHPLVQLFLLSVLNLLIFFSVVLNTLVNLWIVLAAFPVLIISGYFISKTTRSFNHGRRKILLVFGIAPSIISIFFLLNFYISFNPVEETYGFSYDYTETYSKRRGWYKQRSTMIKLDNNKYEEYPGIRTFFEMDDIHSGPVNYRIADGCFGLKIVRNYTFGPSKK